MSGKTPTGHENEEVLCPQMDTPIYYDVKNKIGWC